MTSWVLLLAGCRTAPGPHGLLDQRLDTQIRGLSGLTSDGEGNLWAVAEEVRVLVRIDPGSRRGGDEHLEVFPLVGVPEGMETEAIAWMGTDETGVSTFMLGTETTEERRAQDTLLVTAFDGARAHVVEDLQCEYELWGLEGIRNHGIEGICHVDGHLFVAAELAPVVQGRRYAPVGHRTPDGRWLGHRMWLTSDEGKVSGLTCRRVGRDIELVAIERHFGTTRLLRATLADQVDVNQDLEPAVLVDLDGWLSGRDPSPNFEGVAWVGDDLALVVDNVFGDMPQARADLWWLRPPTDTPSPRSRPTPVGQP